MIDAIIIPTKMLDITIRINALIAYLFLGPIMLLARKDTPLAEPFVRGHAKRASTIILIGILFFAVYHWLHSFLVFGIFGISVDVIILTLIVSLMLLALMAGGYMAFRGIEAHELNWRSISLPQNSMIEGNYSDEDKVRIAASFIPFVGIIIAHHYPLRETRIGRKVGSLITLILLISTVFFSGSTTTLTLILTLLYIGLMVATLVQLFAFSRFLDFGFYEKVPTFLEFDAHIKATVVTAIDFIKIIFGKNKGSVYSVEYARFLSLNMQTVPAVTPYFVPTWVIAVPGANLIALPSLWQAPYREYIPLILQGLFITILMALVIIFYGIGSQMGLFLLFPIITLIIESRHNVLARAPLVSLVLDLKYIFSFGQSTVEEIRQQEEEVHYTYDPIDEQ